MVRNNAASASVLAQWRSYPPARVYRCGSPEPSSKEELADALAKGHAGRRGYGGHFLLLNLAAAYAPRGGSNRTGSWFWNSTSTSSRCVALRRVTMLAKSVPGRTHGRVPRACPVICLSSLMAFSGQAAHLGAAETWLAGQARQDASRRRGAVKRQIGRTAPQVLRVPQILLLQLIDLNGGPVATRTPDLYRVKVDPAHWRGKTGPSPPAPDLIRPQASAGCRWLPARAQNMLKQRDLQVIETLCALILPQASPPGSFGPRETSMDPLKSRPASATR
jgi:hypothetical protein